MHRSLEEVIRKMAARFEPAGRDLAAWPVTPGASEAEVRSVESTLGLKLPTVFRGLVREYDFLNAVAGNVRMSHAGSLSEWLVDPNVAPCFGGRWWRGPTRPHALLLIAQSDAYTFVLDTESDEIKAIWIDDPDAACATIARDFSGFYGGLASLYLLGIGGEEAKVEADKVAARVAAPRGTLFWSHFAGGAA